MSRPDNNSSGTESITWVIVCLTVVCIAVFVVLNFIKARATTAANSCVNNLRQIDAAANQFALESRLTNGAPIHFPDDLTPYIKLNIAGEIPGCPQGGRYFIWRVGQTPKCTLAYTNTSGHVLH